MIPAIDVSKIYSTLGNNSSLVPLAVKDVANSLGLTTGSYIVGDKLEGKDRFLDEFGTQAIWLFGLPVFKKITDLTLYKALKIDPKVDVRLLDNPEILDKAIELEKNDKIKKGLLNLKNNPKFSRSLALSKFGIATALTIASYTALTKYRHKKTKEAAKKEIMAEHAKLLTAKNKFNNTRTSFGDFIKNSENMTNNKNNNKNKTTTFTGAAGLVSKLKDFMFDPVKNLMIVDGSITTERLSESRNKQEFIGYSIKEGATWAFMYFASKPIQKFLEKKAVLNHNKSIDLDARVIESEDLKNTFGNKNIIEQSLKEFPINGSDIEIYEFLHKNPDNFVVQMAKKSDEISTLGKLDNWVNKLKKKLNMSYMEVTDKNAIDTRKFIDIGNLENKSGVKGIYAKIDTLYKQYQASGENLDDFLKKVKTLKRHSVLKNLGVCIAALGVAVPAVMIAVRYLSGDKEFQVKEDLEKEISLDA